MKLTVQLVFVALLVSEAFFLGRHVGRIEERDVTTILATSTDDDDHVMPAIELAAKFCKAHPSARFRSAWGDSVCEADGTIPK